MKKLLLSLTFAALGLFTGCDNNKVDEADETTVERTTTTRVETVEVSHPRDDKYAEFSGEVKEEEHPLAFWTWFDDDNDDDDNDDEAEDEVEYDEEEVEDHPLRFLEFWKEKDGTPKRITEDHVLGDMSPEMDSLTETKGEGKIRTAHVLDTNTRMISDDLRLIFLLDRPSRLTIHPVP